MKRMTSKVKAWAGLALAVLSLCCFCGCEAANASVVQEVFGGDKAFDLMSEADTVTAHRLTEPASKTSDPSKYAEGEAVTVSADLADRIRKLLKSPGTYSFNSAKGCKPVYGIRLKFTSGKDVVDVDLCYQCELLTVSHNGKVVGGEDFDKAAGEFIDIAKRLFPDDKEIQSLER